MEEDILLPDWVIKIIKCFFDQVEDLYRPDMFTLGSFIDDGIKRSEAKETLARYNKLMKVLGYPEIDEEKAFEFVDLVED